MFVALLFAASLGLSGCSSTTFIYNRLDTVIRWYVDDYVSLDRSQRALFDEQLDVFLDWHRRRELPRYITLIEGVEQSLDEPLSDREMVSFYDELTAAAERLRTKMVALALDFGEELTQAQRLEFIAATRREQETWYSERAALDAEAYAALMADRFEDNLTDFMGRLSVDQRATIEQRAAHFERMHDLWHRHRVRWLDTLELAIQQHPSDWQGPVSTILNGWDAERSDDYRRIFEHNRTLTLALIRDVVNSRSDQQDRRLRRTLAGYREDFLDLVEAAPSVE